MTAPLALAEERSNMILNANALHIPLADESVDIVFTSPPFKDEDVTGEYWELYADWMREIFRVATKVVCIIHSATKLNRLIVEYPPKRILIWGKGISLYSWRWNPILVYQMSDEYKVNKYIWNDAFGVESVTGKWKVHPYQDPLLLYYTVLKMFDGCNIVLDPFCGSGTTCAAAHRLGRQFIGFDLDMEYCRDANNRMRNETGQNVEAGTNVMLPLVTP